jgi:uncharacterized membrane protein YdbT with pleckstrin-like domain
MLAMLMLAMLVFAMLMLAMLMLAMLMLAMLMFAMLMFAMLMFAMLMLAMLVFANAYQSRQKVLGFKMAELTITIHKNTITHLVDSNFLETISQLNNACLRRCFRGEHFF